MAVKKENPIKKVAKKDIHKEIYGKLSLALTGYKVQIGAKKFENKLKKASKLFGDAIAKAGKKDTKIKVKIPVVKKVVKKKLVKK